MSRELSGVFGVQERERDRERRKREEEGQAREK